MAGEECQRVSRIGNLVEANHAAALALAFSAAPHIETERDVAEILQHFAWPQHVTGSFVAPKSMQDNECGPPLVGFYVIREADNTGKKQPSGCKCDAFFWHHPP